MKYSYIAMPGGSVNATQAKIVGEELERVAKSDGAIVPARVVDIARPDGSKLHEFFTWDDGLAAELFRQNEAARLIRSVRIIKVGMPAQEQPVLRAFLNVTASDTETKFTGHGYIPLARVESSADYEKQVLDRAKEELRQWSNRYADYKAHFSEMLKEVTEVE